MIISVQKSREKWIGPIQNPSVSTVGSVPNRSRFIVHFYPSNSREKLYIMT